MTQSDPLSIATTTAAPLGASTAGVTASDQLPRRLGLWATTGVVVGTIIGSGIFRVPASVAAEVGSPTAIMLVWVLGGVISLCGALALAELAAALPQSGGVFVYLRQAYGSTLAGIGMTLLGVPVYQVWKAASRRGTRVIP